jgi:hypothetical protein
MDSSRKNSAIDGIRNIDTRFLCFDSLIDKAISIINQDRSRSGTSANRVRRRLNPASV